MDSKIESSSNNPQYPKLRFSDNPYDKFSTLELTFNGLDPLYVLRDAVDDIIEKCKGTEPDSGV